MCCARSPHEGALLCGRFRQADQPPLGSPQESVAAVWNRYTSHPQYAERQKKIIASSERHSLNSKALKWLIIGHRLAIVLLTKHISKNKHLLESKRCKCSEIARGHVKKKTEIAHLPGMRFGTDKSQYSSCITRHWNWMNSYWMFWKGAFCEGYQWALSVNFEKWPFAILPVTVFSFLTLKQPFDFWDVLHKE